MFGLASLLTSIEAFIRNCLTCDDMNWVLGYCYPLLAGRTLAQSAGGTCEGDWPTELEQGVVGLLPKLTVAGGREQEQLARRVSSIQGEATQVNEGFRSFVSFSPLRIRSNIDLPNLRPGQATAVFRRAGPLGLYPPIS